jgi:2-polyprenyl-6-methoxyphenol hydroxylase-like FAD-dependent oxidoreductase
VRFSDGSTGDYELVVGADGVQWSIRRLAFGVPPARYVGQASWRFVAAGFREISDWTVMLGRGRAFLTVALGNGTVYCYADVNTKDPAEARVAERRKCSRTSLTRCRGCSTTPTTHTLRRSRRSWPLPGRPVASRSSATPQKTLVESNAGAAPASPGCRSKPIAVTARGACRRQIRT